MNKFAGKFIVLDGPDGCGKTTQAKLLTESLEKLGIEVISFRDPGTTVPGEAIRDILLSKKYDSLHDAAEVMLYMAARIQLWHEKIKPALENGKCVVMDRWLSSTCAYQGYAGGFGMDNVVAVAELSLPRLWPDITLILDIEISESSSRLGDDLDRMELKGDQYHNLVVQGYRQFAKYADDFGCKNLITVNGSNSIEAVHKEIMNKISTFTENEQQS